MILLNGEGKEDKVTRAKEPTLRARWLGKILKDRRLEANRQVAEVAEYLNRNRIAVPRFENGEYPIPIDELPKLLDLYGIDDVSERAQLLRLAQEVTQRGWWDGYNFETGLANYVWLEENARTIRILAPTLIPGILQCGSYAQTLLAQGPQGDSEDDVRRSLEARLIRSEILKRENGPELKVILHEKAISQPIGHQETLVAQIKHLLELLALPSLDIRLMPIDSWQHIAAGAENGFTLFEMHENWPTVAAAYTPMGTVYAESPEVNSVTGIYESLWENFTLSPSETHERIKEYLRNNDRSQS